MATSFKTHAYVVSTLKFEKLWRYLMCRTRQLTMTMVFTSTILRFVLVSVSLHHDIYRIFLCRYALRKSALELFMADRSNCLFNFGVSHLDILWNVHASSLQ